MAKRATKEKIKADKPEIVDSVVEEVADQYDVALALSDIAKTDGGEALKNALGKDIVTSINKIKYGFTTLPHAELIAVCASLSSSIDIFRALCVSEKRKDILADELKRLLAEE